MALTISPGSRAGPVHCWEPLEIELTGNVDGADSYVDIGVWIDLNGPGLSKRVHGFWDGESTFRVRFVATSPGKWSWRVGGAPSGAVDETISGDITAVNWSEAELNENALRRGFLRPSENGRAFDHADGTPFFLLGDTWWATPTSRYPWDPSYTTDATAGEPPAPDLPGPGISFQSMVEYRRAQGFNSIAILAAFPQWANDGHAPTIVDGEMSIRDAWVQPGTSSAKDMVNKGGRPFEFPGIVPGYEDIVPNLDRINPSYFRELDAKIHYLNGRGFVPFVEVARRDVTQVWRRHHSWPESYGRYIQYVFARLQAFNCLLSPIHFDWPQHALPSRDFNLPANWVIDTYGEPPFGTMLSANSSPSTLANFGGSDEAKWLSFHQTGNWREHDHYWYASEIFFSSPARPCISGEPYYPGFPDNDPPAPGDEATTNFRSGMYGGFLSGALAGYIYGAEGLWGGDVEPQARYRTWDALQFKSGDQVRHLKVFAEFRGLRYRDLIPHAELITPNKSGDPIGYRGWAFCAATSDRSLVLCYLEAECPRVTLRSLKPDTPYRLHRFDPRSGEWQSGDTVQCLTDQTGRVQLPAPPNERDWGLAMEEIT